MRAVCFNLEIMLSYPLIKVLSSFLFPEYKPIQPKIIIMLEHQKKVLLGVADNPYLFRKEIFKSLSWLSIQEVEELYSWVQNEFGIYYAHILGEVFSSISA